MLISPWMNGEGSLGQMGLPSLAGPLPFYSLIAPRESFLTVAEGGSFPSNSNLWEFILRRQLDRFTKHMDVH